MFEQQDPHSRPSFGQERPESFLSSSTLWLGQEAYGEADVYMLYQGVRKQLPKKHNHIVAISTALAVVFLILLCRVRRSVDEASGLTGRMLADGKGDAPQAEGSRTSPQVCRDVEGALDYTGQSRVSGAATPPVAGAGPAASVEEPGEPPAKKLKIMSEGSPKQMEANEGEEVIQVENESIPELLLSDPSDETLLGALLFSESSEGQSGGVAEMEQEDVLAIIEELSELASAVPAISSVSEPSANWDTQSYHLDLIGWNPFDPYDVLGTWRVDESHEPSSSFVAGAAKNLDESAVESPLNQQESQSLLFPSTKSSEGSSASSHLELGSLTQQQMVGGTPSTTGSSTGTLRQAHAFPGLQTAQATAIFSPSDLASTDGASTVQALPVAMDYETHRYFRLPAVPPDMKLEPLDPNFKERPLKCHSLVKCLEPLRNLLVKDSLMEDEVQQLIRHAEELVTFAYKKLRDAPGGSKMSGALRKLATRLWVADFLWCVCDLAGEAAQQDKWWDLIFANLLEPLKTMEFKTKRRREGVAAANVKLGNRLLQALEKYRRRERPAASDVVQLKQETLVERRFRLWFRDVEWNAFRADDNLRQSEDPAATSSSSAHPQDFASVTKQGLTADYRMHRYYRLPTVPAGMKPTPLNEDYKALKPTRLTLWTCLEPMRALFVKESLTQKEMKELFGHTNNLLKFVDNVLSSRPMRNCVHELIPVLAYRFWTAEYLWIAAELLDPDVRKEKWWKSVFEVLLQPAANWRFKDTPLNELHTKNHKFAKRLYEALEKYQQGERPVPSEVVQLKQETLKIEHRCVFKNSEWNVFRADDTFYRQSTDQEASTGTSSQLQAHSLTSDQAIAETTSTTGPIDKPLETSSPPETSSE